RKGICVLFFFFSSRRRHTRCYRDWSSDVCSSDLLRGEPIITVSQGVNGPMAAASLSWLERHTGEPPNVVRQEPPDQMAAALARSGNAIALMTEHRAAQAQTDGLVYRSLTPSPIIEYGP